MPPQKTPAQIYQQTGSLKGMTFGVYRRVSRKAAKTDLEIARRGGGDFDKSTDDQGDDAVRWAVPAEVQLVVYSDVGISGGSGSRDKRTGLIRMLRDAEDHKLDGLWFFDLDRSARDMAVSVRIQDLCEEHGRLIVERDRVLDPTESSDRMTALFKGVMSETRLREIKKATIRGQESNAAQGLPYGPVAYGWVRKKRPGAEGLQLYQSLESQLPDGLIPGTVLEPGQAPSADQLLPGSPAAVVLQCFTRYAEGWYDAKIAADLNARAIGVSRPAGARASDHPVWRASRVRRILLNPAYAGRRVLRGEVLEGVTGQWTPLVPLELFYACENRRAAKRGTHRDVGVWPTGGGPYMMSATALCGAWCGGTMSRWSDSGKSRVTHGHYTCTTPGCWGTSIRQLDLDNYVDDNMIKWLSDVKVQADLLAARGAEAEGEAATARGEVEQYEKELKQLDLDVETGAVSSRMGTIDQHRLEKLISEANLRIRQAGGIPESLRKLLDAPHTWTALPALEKRAIVRMVAEVHVLPLGRGRSNQFSARKAGTRVHWHWLIGPYAGDPPYVLPPRGEPRNRKLVTVTVDGEVIHTGEYSTAGKGELARELMAGHGWSQAECARAMGVEPSSVRYWCRAAA